MLKFAPCQRNKEPILNVFKKLFDKCQRKNVLEIGSGSGEHAAHITAYFSKFSWQPTEIDFNCLKSIDSYTLHYNLTNVRPALRLDINQPFKDWPASIVNSLNDFDIIYCSNMIHISPWSSAQALFSSASQLLKSGSLIILYGPFAVNGKLEPESNVNFDLSLRRQNPEWGIRDSRAVDELARGHNFKFYQMFDMPANNKIFVYQKL